MDFARFKGKKITVRNDAVTPYPSAFAKFTPGLQDRIIQFVVGEAQVADDSYDPNGGGPLRGPGSTVAPSLGKDRASSRHQGRSAPQLPHRGWDQGSGDPQLTLNPIFGSGGCHFPPKSATDPILDLLNNSKFHGLRPDGKPVSGGAEVAGNWQTEFPQLGSTEIWEIIDLTPTTSRSTRTS